MGFFVSVVDQLWPDAVPVVGTKVLPSDEPPGLLPNLDTSLRGDW
jgi:hypothetical protein